MWDHTYRFTSDELAEMRAEQQRRALEAQERRRRIDAGECLDLTAADGELAAITGATW